MALIFFQPQADLLFFSSAARFKGVNLAPKEKVSPEATDTVVPSLQGGCMVLSCCTVSIIPLKTC